MPKICYRIEHPETGKGFYHTRIIDEPKLYDIRLNHNNKLHAIWRECDKFLSGTHYCAFINLKALKNVLDYDEVKALINLGFNVLKLTVNDLIVANDKIQAVYEKENVIKTKNINNQIDKIYN